MGRLVDPKDVLSHHFRGQIEKLFGNSKKSPVFTMLRNHKVYQEGSNQKDRELNLCIIFSMTTFYEIYLFA